MPWPKPIPYDIVHEGTRVAVEVRNTRTYEFAKLERDFRPTTAGDKALSRRVRRDPIVHGSVIALRRTVRGGLRRWQHHLEFDPKGLQQGGRCLQGRSYYVVTPAMACSTARAEVATYQKDITRETYRVSPV